MNLDDDGQNPPEEAVRLWEHARATGLDVVFGHYTAKQHSAWRNVGSRSCVSLMTPMSMLICLPGKGDFRSAKHGVKGQLGFRGRGELLHHAIFVNFDRHALEADDQINHAAG